MSLLLQSTIYIAPNLVGILSLTALSRSLYLMIFVQTDRQTG